MQTVLNADFRKSTFSNHPVYTHCVEVARREGEIFVRDSKDKRGPQLRFTPDEWKAFIAGVKDAQFEL